MISLGCRLTYPDPVHYDLAIVSDKKVTDRQASDIELAKTLKHIRAVASDEQFEKIRRELVSEDKAEAITAKVRALSEEDDFALLCRMMDTTTHVVPLKQSPIIPGDSIVPDFMVRFQPGLWVENRTPTEHKGFTCFVEVKTTRKLKCRIGGSLLKRRRNFAKTFGLPLLFAVRFMKFAGNAYWVVVHDHNLSRSSLTVGVEDLFSSLRHVLFNEYWYMVRPGTRFQYIFEAGERGTTMYHPEHGSLTELRILTSDKAVTFKGNEASLWSAFFEPYRLEEVDTRSKGGQTVQTLEPGVAACSIIDLVYCFNSLPSDQQGNRTYDPTRIIVHADKDPAALLIADRKTIESGALRMQQLGVLWLIGVGEPEEHARLWREYGGAAQAE